MNHVTIYDQAVMVGIHVVTKPMSIEMTPNNHNYYERVSELQAQASFEYSDAAAKLAKQIADAWHSFELTRDFALAQLGGCKAKTLRDLIKEHSNESHH